MKNDLVLKTSKNNYLEFMPVGLTRYVKVLVHYLFL